MGAKRQDSAHRLPGRWAVLLDPLSRLGRGLRWLGVWLFHLVTRPVLSAWRAAGWLGRRLLSSVRRLAGRPARALWRFTGRVGLALRRLLALLVWRPLQAAGRSLRRLIRFFGRVGLALRHLLALFAWHPLLYVTTPGRRLFRRRLQPPLVALLRRWRQRLAGRWAAGRPRRRRWRRAWRSNLLLWRARLRLILRRPAAPSRAVVAPRAPVTMTIQRRPTRLLATLVTINVVLVALSLVLTQQDGPAPVAANTGNAPAARNPASLAPRGLAATPAPGPTTARPAGPTPGADQAIAIRPRQPVPTWTPWPTPNPLAGGGSLVYSRRANGQSDLYAVTLGRAEPLRLTGYPADEVEPAWSPDGRRIAFASNRDGNWELYSLDLQQGEVLRLTDDPAFERAPAWSPDGQWLVYEAYRDNNLDVFIIKADGSRSPIRLTRHPAPDFSPTWAPGGRHIAFTSWRSGNQDIFVMSLDTATDEGAVNLTQSPDRREDHPAFSPAGDYLAYDDAGRQLDLVYALPLQNHRPAGAVQLVGQGRQPVWAPDGRTVLYVHDDGDRAVLVSGSLDAWNASTQAVGGAGRLADPDWTAMVLPRTLPAVFQELAGQADSPLFVDVLDPPAPDGPPYLLKRVPVDVPAPFLSDRVDDSFLALRQAVQARAGWDFLANLDGLFTAIDTPPLPGQSDRTWNKAGRAVDLDDRAAFAFDDRVVVVRQDRGNETTWRLYLRAEAQDGSQGAPLRQIPWDFRARFGPDPQYYDQGGKLADRVPAGYYVDFTALAADYGWQPVPAAANWRFFWPGVLYWHYQNQGGLSWEQAMLELYAPEEILAQFGR